MEEGHDTQSCEECQSFMQLASETVNTGSNMQSNDDVEESDDYKEMTQMVVSAVDQSIKNLNKSLQDVHILMNGM